MDPYPPRHRHRRSPRARHPAGHRERRRRHDPHHRHGSCCSRGRCRTERHHVHRRAGAGRHPAAFDVRDPGQHPAPHQHPDPGQERQRLPARQRRLRLHLQHGHDDDGSDPDPDPDHQGDTTFQDSNGAQLAAHHVPFYVLGDDCWDKKTPCPHFFYKEHGISGRQFALVFYNGKAIGAIFGDTQTGNSQTTSDNDSRELGEASVKAASLLGIPSSGTTGGVDNGVTVAIFSGPSWVVNGTNANLSNNAQALVQNALNTLGTSLAGGTTTPPPSSPPPSSPPPSTTPPTGGNKSYEAEAASLAGGTTITSCAHCSGGKKLSYLGNGGTATFNNITEPTAGSYTMTVSFMSVGQARTATVTVNGVNQTVSFPETPDYNTVVTKNVTVQLKAGNNTIEFSNPSAGAPNLDRIVV
ncbi:glycoside hydrolase family 75 protein [Streptacidiphilus sp. PAMC 29251]